MAGASDPADGGKDLADRDLDLWFLAGDCADDFGEPGHGAVQPLDLRLASLVRVKARVGVGVGVGVRVGVRVGVKVGAVGVVGGRGILRREMTSMRLRASENPEEEAEP